MTTTIVCPISDSNLKGSNDMSSNKSIYPTVSAAEWFSDNYTRSNGDVLADFDISDDTTDSALARIALENSGREHGPEGYVCICAVDLYLYMTDLRACDDLDGTVTVTQWHLESYPSGDDPSAWHGCEKEGCDAWVRAEADGAA